MTMPLTYPPGEPQDRYDVAAVQLVAVPGRDGLWDVQSAGRPVGTWQRTEHGARVSDLAGEVMASADALGAGTAVVASCGRDRGYWSDLVHAVLAGRCEIVPAA
jgi:hypothetical protein